MVYLFLTDKFEEVEALTAVDLLRRAELELVTVSINGTKSVCGSHNIKVEADMLIEDVDWTKGECIVLPGGPGTGALNECKLLMENVDAYIKNGKPVGAICAAPAKVLGVNGYLKGKNAVCYPGLEDLLIDANVMYVPVVTDGNITTARGAGCATDFALELIAVLKGREVSDKIAESIVYSA